MTLAQLRYHLVFGLSWVTLFLERFWASFWPAISVLAVFGGLACVNFFLMFGNMGHLVLLLAFVAAFYVGLFHFGTRFRIPDAKGVRRAIEIQSDLLHRPLEAMTDRPIAGLGKASEQLWDRYQERLKKLWERARIHRPRPEAHKRDPHSLRFASLLVLALGLLFAQHEALFRIKQALTPDVAGYFHMKPVALDVWITPPDYTHLNPVFLATTQLGAAPDKGRILVPENSVLKVRLAGYSHAPKLTYGDTEYGFSQPAADNFTLEIPLKDNGRLKITQWLVRKLGDWQIWIIKDHAPEIVLLKNEKTKRAQLKITYTAKDDYNIKKVSGTIAPTPDLIKVFGTKTIDFDIPAPETDTDEKTYMADLASHPWAGSKVMLTLTAADDIGQTGSTTPEEVMLPERDFSNPVAQKIIAERKKLIWYNNFLTRRVVTGDLADLASKPEDFKYDQIVFLGLDIAVKRLLYDGKDDAVASIVPLLWDLAIRVEDGGLSLSARELSEALQKLNEGLKDKSLTKDQVQDLLDKVNQKMREYTKDLARQMQQRMQDGKQSPDISPDLAQKIMKHIDMQKLEQQMQQMQQGSEREQMEKMSQYLKNSVDNMDLNNLDKMQQKQKDFMQALDDLEKLIQRQQQLMDKTQKLKPQPGKQQQPPQDQKQQDQQDQQQPQNDSGDQQQQQSSSGQQQQSQGSSGQQEQQTGPDGQAQQQQQGSSGQQQTQQGSSGQAQQQQSSQGSQTSQQQGSTRQPQQGSSGQQGTQSSQQQGMPPQPSPDNSGQQQTQQTQQGTGGQQQSVPQLGSNGQQQPVPQQGTSGDQQQQMTQQGDKGQQQQIMQPGNDGKQQVIQQGDKGDKKQQTAGQQGVPPQPTPQGGFKPAPQAQQQQGGGQQGDQQQAAKAGDDGKPIRTSKEGAGEQGDIREKLGDIMRRLGENMPQVPDNFGKSDQEMKQAVQSLKGNDSQGSVPHQKEALDQLEKGEQQSIQQMADQLQQTILDFGFSPQTSGYGQGFDPLGRGTGQQEGNGQPNTGYVQIPDEKERRRVQEIIEDLRNRSNDYSRPKVERDYIDRLLDQFN